VSYGGVPQRWHRSVTLTVMADTLTVRLPPDLANALRRAARESGVPKGAIVREAIAARLQDTTRSSVMSRHFATVHGPEDLSTNKAYRRAWTRKRR
jgi:hypothetical protein